MKKTKTEANQKLKEQARTLFQTGLTMRQVGKAIGKSHTWVWYSLKEPVDKSEEIRSNGKG